MANNQSYNQIITRMELFFNAHMQVKRFEEGPLHGINTFVTTGVTFPAVYAYPLANQINASTQNLTFDLYVLDRLNLDKSNERECYSDCSSIIIDFIKWFRNNNYPEYDIKGNPNIRYITNYTVENLAGAVVTLVVEADYDNTDCDIPIIPFNFPVFSGNSGQFSVDFLTCSNLSDCGTFQIVVDDITNLYSIVESLTGGTSGGNFLPLSGGTLTGPLFGTTFNGTFVGDGSQLTGVTAVTGIDIYTTGATLDSNTSVATFNRNDGNDYTLDLSFLNVPTLQQVTDSGFQTNNPIFISGNTLSISGPQGASSIQILDSDNLDNIVVEIGINPTGQGFVVTNDENGIPQTIINNGDISTTGQYFGDGSQLTGIPDTFVTGGTYNNTTGTATFTNNIGGTFNVSGFTTGGTSGFDVFVTGGTYNNTTGTATFTNNIGGTFTVSGFTTGATGNSDLTVGSTQINSGRTTNILFQSGTTLSQSNAFNYVASSNTLNLSAATANLSLRTPNNGIHLFDSGNPGSGYYIGTAPTVTGTNNYMVFGPGPSGMQFFNMPSGARTVFSFNSSPTGNLDLGNFANRFRVAHSAWATNWELGGRDGNWGLSNTGTQPASTTRGVFWQEIGVAPVASTITDAFQQYAADATSGGTASPHFRTENGNIIKLYQQNTGTTAATRVHNNSQAIHIDDTFDGYTMAQIVKALRNAGFLA